MQESEPVSIHTSSASSEPEPGLNDAVLSSSDAAAEPEAVNTLCFLWELSGSANSTNAMRVCHAANATS